MEKVIQIFVCGDIILDFYNAKEIRINYIKTVSL